MNKFVFTSIAIFLPNLVSAGEIVNPVVDGMTITLGDYVQQVEVRAKSFGPGMCQVEFSIDGESYGFLAPPLTWSPWTKAGPAFIRKRTVKIGFSQGCDTGAIGEIKYSK